MSINPGATINPLASKTSSPFCDCPLPADVFPGALTSLMRSPSSNTSIAASVFVAGFNTRPFLMRSMRGVLYLFRVRVRISTRAGFLVELLIGRAPIARLIGRRRTRLRRRVTCLQHFVLGTAGSEQKQQRHAHRNPVRNLF